MGAIDLTGRIFGRLTALERANDRITPKGYKIIRWLCKCECGNNVIVQRAHLLSGHTQSCGCYRSETVKIKNENNRKYNSYVFNEKFAIGYTDNGTPFYIDTEDYDKIKDYCWCISGGGYVVSTINGRGAKLHRLIMDAKEGEVVDHVNHDILDNRRCNLRIVTAAQNNHNANHKCNTQSGVTGVWWNKISKKWVACIRNNNVRINLGSFTNLDDAVAARKAAEEKYFGEYSYDNSIAAVPRIELQPVG